MCYSAQISADWRRYKRQFGADLSLADFFDLFYRRAAGENIKMPRAVDAAFAGLEDGAGQVESIKTLVGQHAAAETTRLEQELFKQRTRLADAERSLSTKPTKTATETKRIASTKVETILAKLGLMKTGQLTIDDQRVFPGAYAPVMVMEAGERVIKPMRYQCRPAGKPAFYDRKFPGTYNARRDSLGGFWRDLFGYSHGVMVVSAFFENVTRDERNVVLEFRPRPAQDMPVACLYSRWTAPGEPDLLSFAAITDDPPPEVAAAGHDRCIVPIKPQSVDEWLSPEKSSLAALHAILEERDRPYYEHRLAA